jgi:hypothetical protein
VKTKKDWQAGCSATPPPPCSHARKGARAQVGRSLHQSVGCFASCSFAYTMPHPWHSTPLTSGHVVPLRKAARGRGKAYRWRKRAKGADNLVVLRVQVELLGRDLEPQADGGPRGRRCRVQPQAAGGGHQKAENPPATDRTRPHTPARARAHAVEKKKLSTALLYTSPNLPHEVCKPPPPLSLQWPPFPTGVTGTPRE